MAKTIKLLSVLMFALALPMIVACSNDESEPFDIKKAVGTWVCVKSTDTYQGKLGEGLFVGVRITINENGTFTSTSYNFGQSGTYTYRGNQITAKSSAGTFVLTVTIDGDRMTWNGKSNTGINFQYVFQRNKDESKSFDIKKAVGTWVCVKSTDTYEDKFGEGLFVGVRVTINENGTFTSTSSTFGRSGTYTYKGNQITANSSAGTFVLTVTIDGDRMTWNGISDTGINFQYVFQRK
jgi:polyisoprenoid-binding protein YceI